MKEEIFITFGDPRNREVVKEPVPTGFFTNSCEKGLVWALKLDYIDITNTLVSMALTAANNANILLVFKSDDYHKVDKIKWEAAIATNCYTEEFPKDYRYLGFIDDDIDDKYAEYIVSYESIKAVTAIPSYFVTNPDKIDADIFIKVLQGGNPSGRDAGHLDEVIKDTVENSIKANRILLKQLNFDLVDTSDAVSEKNAMDSGQIILFFTLLYAPILLTPIANGCRKMNGIEEIFPVYSRMGDITLKNMSKLTELLNSAVFFYSKGFSGYEEYDKIYNSIYTLLDYKSPWLFDAMLGGIGRNDPCPCGSGKKWKQCHGKN